jgi:hypothetical protein
MCCVYAEMVTCGLCRTNVFANFAEKHEMSALHVRNGRLSILPAPVEAHSGASADAGAGAMAEEGSSYDFGGNELEPDNFPLDAASAPGNIGYLPVTAAEPRHVAHLPKATMKMVDLILHPAKLPDTSLDAFCQALRELEVPDAPKNIAAVRSQIAAYMLWCENST